MYVILYHVIFYYVQAIGSGMGRAAGSRTRDRVGRGREELVLKVPDRAPQTSYALYNNIAKYITL